MNARSLVAVALAAMLVPAGASAATGAPPHPGSPFLSGPSIGGLIGYETDDLSGIMLRLDGELPYGALAPGVHLSWVGSLGFSHLTDSVGQTDLTANIVKIIPAARFSFIANPQLTFFADAGLGLYYSSWTIETPAFLLPSGSVGGKSDGGEVGLVMRFAGGLWFDLNPKTRIGGMIEIDPYFGDVIGNEDQNTFQFMVGAMFRL